MENPRLIEKVEKVKEYRCGCGRLLFKGNLNDLSLIEIKCKRCGGINTFGKKNLENFLENINPKQKPYQPMQ